MSKQSNLVSASQDITVDSSGNVGIGTTSPSTRLHTKAGSNSITDWTFTSQNSAGSAVTEIGAYGYNHNLYHRFHINDTEHMRIDDDGNLLVGKTTNDYTLAGSIMRPGGEALFTRAGDMLTLNRLTSDGGLVSFRKDNSVVGSIDAKGGDLVIHSSASGHCGFRFSGTPSALPVNQSGDTTDNQMDLGNSSTRFDDIYATNGNIQTSDANEKQDVAALTATEMLVAARISALFKTFRWIDSVTDKGDNARTHTGVIAQDVQAAFTAEGLDAGDYALFTSATWWETQTDVPAVVADPANDIEAADAYTRTDTYDTLAEAPAGATERTRMGIRYPELLAFVGAYNEQRFASIETRLAALEAN